MKQFKKILYYYSNLSGKAQRFEFGIYFFYEIVMNIVVLYLYARISLNDENILKL